jgi:hypothetical protein
MYPEKTNREMKNHMTMVVVDISCENTETLKYHMTMIVVDISCENTEPMGLS